MEAIHLCTDLTPDEVATWAAVMRHSPGWKTGYSLNNPRSTDEAVAQVQEARGIRLGICYVGALMCDAHWLKRMNYPEHYAWVDGVVFPKWRGGDKHPVLMATWLRFATWAKSQGYPDLLCASFADNRKAYTWITDVCGFYVVGTMSHGSPHASDGTLKPVVVFASAMQDQDKARQRAELVYTQGEWVKDVHNDAM